jgi:transposase, IS30 family
MPLPSPVPTDNAVWLGCVKPVVCARAAGVTCRGVTCLSVSGKKSLWVVLGESIRSISRRLGRSPSTISRELARNRGAAGGYRATTAHPLAYEPASRPKPAKLVTNVALRARVELDLETKYSPEQIAGRLPGDHPNDPEMWVSTETIYQSLYVQSRGALRRGLAKCLRTGRGLRQPNRQGAQRKSRVLPVLPDMVNIAARPAEADDRSVPDQLRL